MDIQIQLFMFFVIVDDCVMSSAAAPNLIVVKGASEFDTILAKIKYDRNMPPSKDYPTQVNLGIYVNSFYTISEQTMDYSVSMYLRQAWRDHRLQYNAANDKAKKIRLGEDMLTKIWIPDTFFRNEKGASFHNVTVPNRLLFLNSTGHLWYVTKITGTFSCPMNLIKYPLDTQTCPMMFESFGYTMDTMNFTWLDNPVDIDRHLQLPQFSLQEEILNDCSQNYTSGAYPCLEIRLVLSREIGYFLIQVYVPSVLIVTISWLSFWINVEATPARVSLGLLTVLAMTIQSESARSALPSVSYITAMDVWMSVCLIFVCASLLEYVIVNAESRSHGSAYKTQKPQIPSQYRVQNHQMVQINIEEKGSLRRASAQKRVDLNGKLKARRIDKVSRKCFPLVFLLFVIIYWTLYTFVV